MKTSNANVVWFKIIAIIIIATSVTSCNRDKVQKAAPPDQSEIYKIIDRQRDAWNAGNLEGFMDVYAKSDCTMFVTTRGVDMGYDVIFERYKKAYDTKEKMGQLAFDSLILMPITPKVAAVKGNWHLYRNTDTIGGIFSTIYLYKKGSWKIVYDHTN